MPIATTAATSNVYIVDRTVRSLIHSARLNDANIARLVGGASTVVVVMPGSARRGWSGW